MSATSTCCIGFPSASWSDSETTEYEDYVRLIQERVELATRLLSEVPLPEQLVFDAEPPPSRNDRDNSSVPSRVVVAHAAQNGPDTSALESQVVPATWLHYGLDVRTFHDSCYMLDLFRRILHMLGHNVAS
ncbi:hypothetical protein MTO96_046067 [Rhipicephalus appendiculatus]